MLLHYKWILVNEQQNNSSTCIANTEKYGVNKNIIKTSHNYLCTFISAIHKDALIVAVVWSLCIYYAVA